MKKILRIISVIFMSVFFIGISGCSDNSNQGNDDNKELTLQEQVKEKLLNNGQLSNISFKEKQSYDNEIIEIEYETVNYLGKKVKIFAFYGIPKSASITNKVPGIVLVHGGGGTAYPQWVRKWVDEGYAAIAMDTVGTRFNSANEWGSGNDPENIYNGPTNDGLATFSKNIEEQWAYQAVSAVICANSILQNSPVVDNTKIGITGISWGGLLTSVTMGIDNRFKFAIPVYGCGHLSEGKASFGNNFFDVKAMQLWEPSNYFNGITDCKVLWVNSDHDGYFSLNSTSKSFTNLKDSTISIHPDLSHSHYDGWSSIEIVSFANSVVGKAQNKIATFKSLPSLEMGKNVSVEYSIPENCILANVNVYALNSEYKYTPTSDYLAYQIKNDFVKLDIDINQNNNFITFTLPEDVKSYYINIITKDKNQKNYISSSNLIELN